MEGFNRETADNDESMMPTLPLVKVPCVPYYPTECLASWQDQIPPQHHLSRIALLIYNLVIIKNKTNFQVPSEEFYSFV